MQRALLFSVVLTLVTPLAHADWDAALEAKEAAAREAEAQKQAAQAAEVQRLQAAAMSKFEAEQTQSMRQSLGAAAQGKSDAEVKALYEARNKAARAGYTLLEKKYYLDDLYEGVIVAGTKGPIARAMYWVNQHVLDAVVNGVATGARGTAKFLYRFVDQGAIDGTVNASGSAAEGSGQLLRGIQTGKISNYAALLFGGVVLIAGIFVIIV